MYYNRLNGYAYRFAYEDLVDDDPDAGVIYSWVEVSTDLTEVLQAASTAQDTADDKRRVYVITPTPPYDKGDLWSDGVNLKVSGVDRAEGSSYVAADWTPAANYITTYFAQASSPPSSPNTGDMWTVVDASDNVLYIQRYNGTAWVSLTVATLANVDTQIIEQKGICRVIATGVTTAHKNEALCVAVAGNAWESLGALASRTDTVSSTVGEHTSSISAQATSINGLESEYSVKIDNNGNVSGFGLSSGTAGCLVNGVLDTEITQGACTGTGKEWVTDSSTFLVAADTFAITGTDETPVTPFIVRTGDSNGSCYVNGVEDTYMGEADCFGTPGGSWVPPNTSIVGIQGSLVLDGTMNANAIVAGSITGDHINGTTITAGHIDTGSAFIGMTIQSANYVAADNNGTGGSGWSIDSSGNAEFATGNFGGSIQANQLITHDGAGFDIDAAGQAGPTNDANIWGGVIKGAIFEAGYLVEMGANTYTEHYVLTNPNCTYAELLNGKYRYPRAFGDIISSPGYNAPVSARTHTYDVYGWNKCTNTLRRLNKPTADITIVSTTGLLDKSFNASCVCSRDSGTKTYSVAVTTPNGTTETFTFSGRAWFNSSWGFHEVYVNDVLEGSENRQQGSSVHYSGTEIINGVSISWEVDVNADDYFNSALWGVDSINGYYNLTMKIHINQSTLSDVSMTGSQVFKFTTTGGDMKIPPVDFV